MQFPVPFLRVLRDVVHRGEGGRRAARGALLSFRPCLEELESRWVPSVTLGSAADFAVLGLQHTQIVNSNATISGNEGVSQGGKLENMPFSKITGNVSEYSAGEYTGRGKLQGSLAVSPTQLAQADADALNASAQARALTPTQTFGSITHTTTVIGDGGVNVIQINGNIKGSLILKGTANDVFIINVSGNVDLSGNEKLGLAGGVTADHVLYNFTGAHGSITTHAGNVVDGTLLAPTYRFSLDGVFHGEIIGGGSSIHLLAGAKIHQVSFTPPSPPPCASLSGSVMEENNNIGEAGVLITLTNTTTGQTWTMYTAADGSFRFTGLSAGTYSITESPASWQNDVANNHVGSLGGSTSTDVFSGIVVQAGDNGTGYTFENNPSGGPVFA